MPSFGMDLLYILWETFESVTFHLCHPAGSAAEKAVNKLMLRLGSARMALDLRDLLDGFHKWQPADSQDRPTKVNKGLANS